MTVYCKYKLTWELWAVSFSSYLLLINTFSTLLGVYPFLFYNLTLFLLFLPSLTQGNSTLCIELKECLYLLAYIK